MEERWLSIVEYARTFQVSDMTVRRRIKTGKIPHTLRNGKYFIPVVLDRNGHPVAVDSKGSNQPQNQKQTQRQSSSQRSDFESGYYKNNSEPLQQEYRPKNQRDVVQNRPTQGSHLNASHFESTHGFGLAPERTEAPAPIANSYVAKPRTNLSSGSAENSPELQRMLNVCDRVLSELQQSNQIVKRNSEAEISLLQQELSIKEAHISKLNQQLEDLQVLVKILESKYK